MDIHTLSDPARFAEAIRDLAQDAHETLRSSPSSADLRRVSRRIELLATAAGGGTIGIWLDNLGREVRSATVRRKRSSRRMCICA